MPINFFELEELASSVYLSLENTEKELFHDIFLYSLFNFPNLKKYVKFLVFKGGTCLYKCYGFPRFSEDIDFDITEGKLNKKNIELIFNKHLKNILGEIFGFGNINFRIKENPTGFNIHTNIRGPAYSQTHRDCHIKFDLSSRKKLIYGIKKMKYNSLFLKYYGIENAVSLRAVNLKEIFAEKIITILDKKFISSQRDESRDLFDIYMLLLKGEVCSFEDIKKKLPFDKKDVFTLKNFSDSIYYTSKSDGWDIMINQLIIKSKLKEFGLSIEDFNFYKLSKSVVNKINHLYF